MEVWIGNMQNFKQIWGIKKDNLKRIQARCPDCDERSGIYCFHRIDENGIIYAYIGQAKRFCDRMPDHLTGYSPFDLSLKKHGLYSSDNPYGYKPIIVEETNDLDAREQYWIIQYARNGYQLRNITTGSQGEGKKYMDVKSPKTYTEGKNVGYKKAIEDINKLLPYVDILPKYGKLSKRQYEKLMNILKSGY